MMFTILMLLSHAITDFMLQTDESVRLKSEMKPAGYLYHGLVLFTVSAVMLFFMDTAALPGLLIRVVVIVLLHILIDVLKEYLQKAILGNEKRSGHKRNRDVLLLFVADQMVHILMIFLLTEGASAGMISSQPFVLVAVKTLFIILYLTFSGAYLIPLLFNVVYSNVDDYGERLNERLKADMDKDTHVFIDEVKTGKWIGILERLLILVLLYANQFTAIGFIIAIKSLARFRMLDSKIFSEYYLLGTLFSVAYSICGYYLFQLII